MCDFARRRNGERGERMLGKEQRSTTDPQVSEFILLKPDGVNASIKMKAEAPNRVEVFF